MTMNPRTELVREAEAIYRNRISRITGKPGITKKAAFMLAIEARFLALQMRIDVLENERREILAIQQRNSHG